ncbi:hypothetical protein GCM10028805_00740 [Spirosoma harenae]
MNKTEHNANHQPPNYHLELPAQFTSWNGFYDELIRLDRIQPANPIVHIKLFRAADSIKEGDSISINLTFERQHIERMCLEEFRQQRAMQARYMLTSHQLEHLIGIVSNQASHLMDWDLLVKLKELLVYQQQQEKHQSSFI